MYCSNHHQKADITIDNDNVPGSWRKLGRDDFENPLEDNNVVNEAEMIRAQYRDYFADMRAV